MFHWLSAIVATLLPGGRQDSLMSKFFFHHHTCSHVIKGDTHPPDLAVNGGLDLPEAERGDDADGGAGGEGDGGADPHVRHGAHGHAARQRRARDVHHVHLALPDMVSAVNGRWHQEDENVVQN